MESFSMARPENKSFSNEVDLGAFNRRPQAAVDHSAVDKETSHHRLPAREIEKTDLGLFWRVEFAEGFSEEVEFVLLGGYRSILETSED
jgi:hypothetical protein